MATKLFDSLVTMFGRNTTQWQKDMLAWAKTEYGNDWQFAYDYLIRNNGKPPHMGVHN